MTFTDSHNVLSKLSYGLRKSVELYDNDQVQKHCLSILAWGGVLPKNRERILGLGEDIAEYMRVAKDTLNPNTFDLKSDSHRDIIMNSGFTKIYSLLIDEFIIYDGRVGAALGLLARKFCEEKDYKAVPMELRFAYGNARTTKIYFEKSEEP